MSDDEAGGGAAARSGMLSAADTSRRIRVIWNRNAGRKAGIRTNGIEEADLRKVLADRGLDSEVVPTDDEKEAAAAARSARNSGYDIIVAAGGDGTAGCAARELVGSDTALAMLPLGSAMNLLRALGIPRDLGAAADVIVAGRRTKIDVGETRGGLFLESGSVGLSAALFREAQRVDRGHLHAIARALWIAVRYRPAAMKIELDHRSVRTRALMVTVANGPYTGLGLTLAPEAKLDDGLLDVCVFSRFSHLELIRHFVSIVAGRHRYSAKISTYRSKRVRLEGDRALPCRVDARGVGTTPVEFWVRPASLTVIVPEPADGQEVRADSAV